jgi:acyl-CoA synthetase (AMP-forming)/AMP-acid ligase II
MCDAILGAARAEPQNGFTFQDDRGVETFLSFPAIEAATRSRAAALQMAGLAKGDRLGLVVIDHRNFVLTFLAALRVGIVPVPLYPPVYLGNLASYLQHTAAILTSAMAPVLCCSNEVKNILWSLVDKVPSLRTVIVAEELDGDRAPEIPAITPEDVVFLQYTSGSTGQPKGVAVTHRCLIANLHAFTTAGLNMDPRSDVGVSWLPLFHDMGLIGFVLGSIYCGVSVVYIPTLRFIKNANVWLDTIHRHRGTVSFAPNFAFALATRRARPSDLERWDLSCARNFGCAAEPIHVGTARAFLDKFAACKFPESALAPAYGLAEATLAVTMKPLREPLRVERVDHARFASEGRASPAMGDTRVAEHISSGVPLAGLELAIVRGGDLVGDGIEGEILVRGPSVAPGYSDAGALTPMVGSDGWLHTGDLGYLREGHLFVTGRIKDLIILNGRNIHPQVLEWAAASVAGVRHGNVVAFSRPGETTEEVIIVAEAKGEPRSIEEAIAAELRRLHGVVPAEVVVVKSGMLPKTSSGKLQRQRVRQLHRSGELGVSSFRSQGGTGAQIKLAGHVMQSLWARVKAKVAPK